MCVCVAACVLCAGSVRFRPSGGRRARVPTRRFRAGPGQLRPELVEGGVSRADRNVPSELRHSCHAAHVNARVTTITVNTHTQTHMVRAVEMKYKESKIGLPAGSSWKQTSGPQQNSAL